MANSCEKSRTTVRIITHEYYLFVDKIIQMYTIHRVTPFQVVEVTFKMSSEYVKRSIVLTENVAEEVERIATLQGRSFASLVRDAINLWLEQKEIHVTKTTSSAFEIELTNEEQELVKKLSALLGVDNGGVIKQCWNEGLKPTIDFAMKRKANLEAMTKNL